MPPRIRTESIGDDAMIRQVNRLAFGQDDEACLVDALREGGYVHLSLVAEQDGQVVFAAFLFTGRERLQFPRHASRWTISV